MNHIHLLPKQRQVLTMPAGVDADYALYQGGFGSGKSYTGAMFGVLRCQQYPGSRGLVVSDTLRRLKRTTLDSYRELLRSCGLVKGRDWHWRSTDSELVIERFDSLIHFVGMGEGNDPTDVRSLNVDWIHIEEGSLIPEASFLELLGRLRGGQGKPRVIITTNPQERKGWLYDWFVTKAGITTENIDGKDVQISIRRVIAPTMDNPHLSASFLAGLKQLDEKAYKMNVLGEDGDYSEGLVSYNFSSANIDENLVYDPTRRLYVSCDFNFDPNCWIIAQRYGREYHFIDEICLENSDSSNNARALGEKYGDHEADIVILGDASGKAAKSAQVDPKALAKRSTRQVSGDYLLIERTLEDVFGMGRHRFDFDYPDGNGSIDKRVKAWNAATCDVSGVRRIKIHPRCKWLLWNIQNLYYQVGTTEIWKPHASDIKKDERLKFVGHIFDAASYLVNRYSPLEQDPQRSHRHQVLVSEPFVPRRKF